VFGFVSWLIFLTAFIALAVYDIHWLLLPDRIVYPLIVLAIIQVLINATVFNGGWQEIMRAGWGILFVAGLFYALFMLSQGKWIGFGDVKLAIVLGILVGGPLRSLLLIFVSSLLGSLVAVPLLIQKRARVTTHIPFGPFLLAATAVVVLFGSHITDWYTGLFYLR
jgi:leader peptidase (prepilin peptidase)/N-methyltransferase